MEYITFIGFWLAVAYVLVKVVYKKIQGSQKEDLRLKAKTAAETALQRGNLPEIIKTLAQYGDVLDPEVKLELEFQELQSLWCRQDEKDVHERTTVKMLPESN